MSESAASIRGPGQRQRITRLYRELRRAPRNPPGKPEKERLEANGFDI